MTRRTPWGRYSEAVQLARPGETLRNEVTFRNMDSCDAPRATFTLSWGYHPPHDGSPAARIEHVRLLRPDGTLHPPYVQLAPGEEDRAFLEFTLKHDQPAKGYVTPSIFMARQPKSGNYLVDYFDVEGPCTAVGYDYWEARAFVYPPQPPT